jgi:hypothetical protein
LLGVFGWSYRRGHDIVKERECACEKRAHVLAESEVEVQPPTTPLWVA